MSNTNTIIKNIKLSKKYSPVDDYYNYINNEWCVKTKIPADRSRWGITEELNRDVLEKLNKLIKGMKPTTKQRKLIRGTYDSYTNKNFRNELDFQPLVPYFNFIDNNDNYEIFKLFTKCGIENLFMIDTMPAMKNSSLYVAYFFENGLGLPEKSYYFDTDKEDIRNHYKSLLKSLLKFIGYTNKDCKIISNKIFEIEKNLAKHSLSLEESRDMDIYKEISRKKEFDSKMNKLLDELEVPDRVTIENKKFYKFVEKLLEKDLKEYFKMRLLLNFASLLSERFEELMFSFYSVQLNGIKKQLPMWKRTINFINKNIGEILADEYVKIYFPESSKKKMIKIVKELIKALRQHIKKLDWMEEKTKEKALLKLSKMRFKIGYPEKFEKFEDIEIFKHPVDMVIQLNNYNFKKYVVDKFEKSVDKRIWHMLATEINAYYAPDLNEFVFPAGILQAPFFDPKADNAYNYGSIGSVIGHEMTHGYDDQGMKFDEDGNLNNWWTKKDLEEYQKRAKKIEKQYDNYELYGKKLNGKLTLGENIADLGGLVIAYTAMTNVLGDSEENAKKFIKSFGLSWRTKKRKKRTIKDLVTDVHSPAIFRVNGSLFNFPVYQKVYCTREGDKMYNKDIIKIW